MTAVAEATRGGRRGVVLERLLFSIQRVIEGKSLIAEVNKRTGRRHGNRLEAHVTEHPDEQLFAPARAQVADGIASS